jgi:hypothetical protein
MSSSPVTSVFFYYDRSEKNEVLQKIIGSDAYNYTASGVYYGM